ncbi:hypothetical protein FDA94_28645 [Herbidospora galbida]|uniref:Uncharacterized protein n=1 Tax=Herbidospora galbida TaxID=2575442 RepID=A0A4U3M720_9ACTN|nr:hypothetical protein [Herbidospora galbida]TKK84601.1 hypothetical protein FDA94_28645 [Herbidospora galbida]
MSTTTKRRAKHPMRPHDQAKNDAITALKNNHKIEYWALITDAKNELGPEASHSKLYSKALSGLKKKYYDEYIIMYRLFATARGVKVRAWRGTGREDE